MTKVFCAKQQMGLPYHRKRFVGLAQNIPPFYPTKQNPAKAQKFKLLPLFFFV